MVMVIGTVAKRYPPRDLCDSLLQLAYTNLHVQPVLAQSDLRNALREMERDIEYCITIPGTMGMRGYDLFNQLEIQFTQNVVKKARAINIDLLDMSEEVLTYGISLLRESRLPSSRASFTSDVEPSGHIWFFLKGSQPSRPRRLLTEMCVFVESIENQVRVAFGEYGTDGVYRVDIIARVREPVSEPESPQLRQRSRHRWWKI